MEPVLAFGMGRRRFMTGLKLVTCGVIKMCECLSGLLWIVLLRMSTAEL